MSTSELGSAPVLSTPDAHIFEDATTEEQSSTPRLDDQQLFLTYEIQRTVDEIRAGRWKRIALQFPDHMLVDAPRVFQALSRGLRQARKTVSNNTSTAASSAEQDVDSAAERLQTTSLEPAQKDEPEKLYILADTSYGACCVDEVAAEHADADVVVHYGRSCLSPTARLPVIYVFTKPPLSTAAVIQSFQTTYPNKDQPIILMADIPYNSYLPDIASALTTLGYTSLFATSILHSVSSPLPNRTVPASVAADPSTLSSYALFHIADPPPSLLLTLSSRVASIHIFSTLTGTTTSSSSHLALRRRYALLTRLSTVSTFGILINTLSVASYLAILAHLKRLIAAAGKKSYTFVVGKVNAAKVANFSEVGGWVVVGCWESSLFESREFWRPVITPWELEVALVGDEERMWTGKWSADFMDVLREGEEREREAERKRAMGADGVGDEGAGEQDRNDDAATESHDLDSEEESEPPEFDLRTGRYVSHSRPMGRQQKPSAATTNSTTADAGNTGSTSSTALTRRAGGALATINGVVSPAAEFFKNKRTWQGLGSDYEIAYEQEDGVDDGGGAKMEQGRKGIARGYVVGDDVVKR